MIAFHNNMSYHATLERNPRVNELLLSHKGAVSAVDRHLPAEAVAALLRACNEGA